MSDPVADEGVELKAAPPLTKAEPIEVDSRVFDRDFDAVEAEPESKEEVLPASSTPASSSLATSAASEPCKVTFRLTFLDPAGHSIEGLGYRILVGNSVTNGTTDANGVCAPLTELLPGSSLEILIRRDDGAYASKYRGEVPSGDTEMCAISPWIKIPVTTEEHHGEPANAQQPLPKPPTPSQTAAAGSSKPTAKASPPVDQKPSGGKKPDVKPQTCRTDQGHPRARLSERFVDWADQHGIPTFGLWNWKKLIEQPTIDANACPGKGESPQAPAAKTGTTNGAPTQNTTPQPQASSVTSANQSPPQQVLDLIRVMDEQVKWPWKSLASAGEIVSRINVKTFVWPTEFKSETQSDHRCYKAVKVGLWRAGYVRAVNEDIPAYTAGRWLLSQDFRDVTRELPDARWAWPGDVIVYQYPEAKRAKNDAAAKEAYQKKLKAYEQKKDAAQKSHAEWAAAKKDFDASKVEWEKANSGKKYAKKFARPEPKMPPMPSGPEDTNYGHIEVRTYDGYESDFYTPQLARHSELEVTGIYRRISDPLPDLRLRSFLKVLRDWETKDIPEEKKYYAVFSGSGPKKYTSDLTKHPMLGIKTKHSPAGAYQILCGTYSAFVESGEFNGSFMPIDQDRMAVALIESTAPRGRILANIRSGRIEEAARALKTIWAVLPGGQDPAGSMDDLLNIYKTNLEAFIKK